MCVHTLTGHGECINSVCMCNDQFTGGRCDCTLDNSTCMNPKSFPGDDLCTGAGECRCGLCICNDYSLTFGQYCEECVVRWCCVITVCSELVVKWHE